MKKLLFYMMSFLPIVASAYDFKYEGIVYNVVSDAERTAEVASKPDIWLEAYQGDVVIPPYVSYNGVEFEVIGLAQAAFDRCTSITSVSLPNTLKYIGKEAFCQCTELHSIIIPESVVEYGYDVFSVSWIEEITVLNPIPVEVLYNAFVSPQMNGCILYVPVGSKDDYRHAPEWNKFEVILEIGEEYNPDEPEEDEDNKHEYVDLGLPSGKLWAKTNVGAKKEYDYGDYFAFGEMKTKNQYWLQNYKWYDQKKEKYTKYCKSLGTEKSSLLREDDVATQLWGEMWHIPSRSDYIELLENCTSSWEKNNGEWGRRLTGKNGNSIFFLAAGLYCSSVDYDYERGYYITSDSEDDEYCILFRFTNVEMFDYWLNLKHQGYSVRPIVNPKETSINSLIINTEEIEHIYNIQGEKRKELSKGLNIIWMKNGHIKKVIKR